MTWEEIEALPDDTELEIDTILALSGWSRVKVMYDLKYGRLASQRVAAVRMYLKHKRRAALAKQRFEEWRQLPHPSRFKPKPRKVRKMTITQDVEPRNISDRDVIHEATLTGQLESVDVQELELSVRAANCLKDAQINTLGQLLACTDAQLLSLRNFGRRSLNEIKELLAEYGLALGKGTPIIPPPPVTLRDHYHAALVDMYAQRNEIEAAIRAMERRLLDTP